MSGRTKRKSFSFPKEDSKRGRPKKEEVEKIMEKPVEIDIKNESYLYIPEIEMTAAEEQALAVARGENAVIEMKKLEPESCYMHRPKNEEWIISKWTAQDVLEWSINFLDEESYELFERLQLTGKTLPSAINSPDSLINSGLHPFMFRILLSHYNKAVNMNNGFH